MWRVEAGQPLRFRARIPCPWWLPSSSSSSLGSLAVRRGCYPPGPPGEGSGASLLRNLSLEQHCIRGIFLSVRFCQPHRSRIQPQQRLQGQGYSVQRGWPPVCERGQRGCGKSFPCRSRPHTPPTDPGPQFPGCVSGLGVRDAHRPQMLWSNWADGGTPPGPRWDHGDGRRVTWVPSEALPGCCEG